MRHIYIIIVFILFSSLFGVQYVNAQSLYTAGLSDYCISSCDYWGENWYGRRESVKHVGQCNLLYHDGCTAEEDYQRMVLARDRYEFNTKDYDTISTELYQCRQSINAYMTKKQAYTECTSRYSDYDSILSDCGEHSSPVGSHRCQCDDGYFWADRDNAYSYDCILECPEGSIRVDGRCVDRFSPNKPVLEQQSFLVHRPVFDSGVRDILPLYESRIKSRRVYTQHIPTTIIQGYLIKSETSPECYLVDEQGLLRWVENEQVASRLFGVRWEDEIIWVDDSVLGGYVFGASVGE